MKDEEKKQKTILLQNYNNKMRLEYRLRWREVPDFRIRHHVFIKSVFKERGGGGEGRRRKGRKRMKGKRMNIKEREIRWH